MDKQAGPLFEPSVLKWAREKAGLSVEVLASKLEAFWKDITPQLIHHWEIGKAAPTPTQVKKLAEIYKRPLAVFLLAAPPDENALPPDRRTLGSHASRGFSPHALLTIRRARRVQSLAAELNEELRIARPFKYPKQPADNPVALASKIRTDLSVSITAGRRGPRARAPESSRFVAAVPTASRRKTRGHFRLRTWSHISS